MIMINIMMMIMINMMMMIMIIILNLHKPGDISASLIVGDEKEVEELFNVFHLPCLLDAHSNAFFAEFFLTQQGHVAAVLEEPEVFVLDGLQHTLLAQITDPVETIVDPKKVV